MITTAATSASTPWLVRFAPRPAAALRLFCFSYAGGGAAVYRPWALNLPDSVEVLAVQLPGREGRLREPTLRRMPDLLEALLPALLPQFDRPFAFWGHSMGALVAYEAAHSLRGQGGPQPARLLLSARRPPQVPDRDASMQALDDAAFVAEIQRRYNGIPAEVTQYPELLELLLPALRADMALIETHQQTTAARPHPRFEGPISVFGGADDARAPRHELEAWQAHTGEPVVLRQFAGGHFYFNDASVRGALLSAVADDLKTHLRGPARVASP
jgi:surfactin synthase thioesterase subunit